MDKVEADEENHHKADNIIIGSNNALPSPSVDSSSYNSGEEEVVNATTLADTGLAFAALGCITNDEEIYNDDHANAGGRAERRSFLKSPKCTAILVVLMIASVAFLASIFVFAPRLGQGSKANVNYIFRDGYNESNATQIEIEDDISSILMEDMIFSTSAINMEDTISPSPALSPFELYLPMEEQLDSGSPSVSPTQYPQLLVIDSIALKVDEDTFNSTGETQKQEEDGGTYSYYVGRLSSKSGKGPNVGENLFG